MFAGCCPCMLGNMQGRRPIDKGGGPACKALHQSRLPGRQCPAHGLSRPHSCIPMQPWQTQNFNELDAYAASCPHPQSQAHTLIGMIMLILKNLTSHNDSCRVPCSRSRAPPPASSPSWRICPCRQHPRQRTPWGCSLGCSCG